MQHRSLSALCLAASFLLLPLGSLLLSLADYSITFTPHIRYLLWAYAPFLCAAAIRSRALPSSLAPRIITVLLPLLAAVLYVFLLCRSASPLAFFLPAMALWAGLFLYLFCALPAGHRRIPITLYVISLLASLSFTAGALFASNFVPVTLESLSSPNGQYTASLIYTDQGALGESTHVEIRQPDSRQDFFFAAVEKTPVRIFVLRGSEPSLHWLDDKTLQVGDTTYPIP